MGLAGGWKGLFGATHGPDEMYLENIIQPSKLMVNSEDTGSTNLWDFQLRDLSEMMANRQGHRPGEHRPGEHRPVLLHEQSRGCVLSPC